jgi:flagellar motor component MotA
MQAPVRSLRRFGLVLAVLAVALGISATAGHTGDAVIIAALLAVGVALLAALFYLPRHLTRRSGRSGE